MTMTRTGGSTKIPETYRELVEILVPRPIHDDIELENTQTVVDALSARDDLNADQDDYLDLLSQLIEAYEAEHTPELTNIHGVDLLRHLVSENSMTGDALANILKVDRSTAYKILRKDRKLNIPQIKLLAKHFHLSTEAFV